MSNNWTYSSKLCFFKKLPQWFRWEKLCEDDGYTYHWISGQKPHLIRNGKRIVCNISNYVPFVVPGLSTSSSSTTPSPTSPSSLSQDSVFDVNRYTKIQHQKEVEVRVKSFGETRCLNPQITGESQEVQRDISHELPNWLQDFRENLVDESTSTDPW